MAHTRIEQECTRYAPLSRFLVLVTTLFLVVTTTAYAETFVVSTSEELEEVLMTAHDPGYTIEIQSGLYDLPEPFYTLKGNLVPVGDVVIRFTPPIDSPARFALSRFDILPNYQLGALDTGSRLTMEGFRVRAEYSHTTSNAVNRLYNIDLIAPLERCLISYGHKLLETRSLPNNPNAIVLVNARLITPDVPSYCRSAYLDTPVQTSFINQWDFPDGGIFGVGQIENLSNARWCGAFTFEAIENNPNNPIVHDPELDALLCNTTRNFLDLGDDNLSIGSNPCRQRIDGPVVPQFLGHISANIGCQEYAAYMTNEELAQCMENDVDGNGYVNAGDRGTIIAAIRAGLVCSDGQVVDAIDSGTRSLNSTESRSSNLSLSRSGKRSQARK